MSVSSSGLSSMSQGASQEIVARIRSPSSILLGRVVVGVLIEPRAVASNSICLSQLLSSFSNKTKQMEPCIISDPIRLIPILTSVSVISMLSISKFQPLCLEMWVVDDECNTTPFESTIKTSTIVIPGSGSQLLVDKLTVVFTPWLSLIVELSNTCPSDVLNIAFATSG